MLIERIGIRFNEYIFDNFYKNFNDWPKIDICSIHTYAILPQVDKVEEIDGIKLPPYYTASGEGILHEEDMVMMVPKYFLELFEDLVPMTIDDVIKSYYSV